MKPIVSVPGAYRLLSELAAVIEVDYGADALRAFRARRPLPAANPVGSTIHGVHWQPVPGRAMPTGVGRIACSVLEFETATPVVEAARLLHGCELLPALLEELGVFDERYPEERSSPRVLAALGTQTLLWGDTMHPCLFETERGRVLDAVGAERVLRPGDRVLGVCLLDGSVDSV